MHLFFDLTQANFLEVLAGRAVQLTHGPDYLLYTLRHVLEWRVALYGSLDATVDSGGVLAFPGWHLILQPVDRRLRLTSLRRRETGRHELLDLATRRVPEPEKLFGIICDPLGALG